MCGITAYFGSQNASEVLVNGLKRLEYRGYDSAGVAVSHVDEGKPTISCLKKKGKVSELESSLKSEVPVSGLGIGHTRWATHGPPSDVNAHPHVTADGSIALVHNGIIENYTSLKHELSANGYEFRSETDTEVLVALVHSVMQRSPGKSLTEVLSVALTQVRGAFGIAVISTTAPGTLVGARRGSPLLVGVGTDETFLASDASAIIEYTKNVVYLNDGDVVTINKDGFVVTDLHNLVLPREIHQLEITLSELEKGGYEHFMLKEIMDQPRTLETCMKGRVDPARDRILLGGLVDVMPRIQAASRLIICACGTSWHAALVGEYMLERWARIPVEVEYASEFIYRDPVLSDTDVVIVISQSGETADTLAAVRLAKANGCLSLGICNTVGSTIARETDAGVYLHAGPEIGVASTKAFTAQILVLAMMSLNLARERATLAESEVKEKIAQLHAIPKQVEEVLRQNDTIRQASREYKLASNFLYLGRGFNFPVALEGALKNKEISYVQAQGYPAAEMKHGPIALIDPFMPVVFIAPSTDATYEKIKSNVEEVLARDGSIILITDEDNHEMDDKCEHVFRFPQTDEALVPLLSVIPLQLLAYHIADLRRCAIDQPRNLAKSVTVE